MHKGKVFSGKETGRNIRLDEFDSFKESHRKRAQTYNASYVSCADVRYHEFPGCGHVCWWKAFEMPDFNSKMDSAGLPKYLAIFNARTAEGTYPPASMELMVCVPLGAQTTWLMSKANFLWKRPGS